MMRPGSPLGAPAGRARTPPRALPDRLLAGDGCSQPGDNCHRRSVAALPDLHGNVPPPRHAPAGITTTESTRTGPLRLPLFHPRPSARFSTSPGPTSLPAARFFRAIPGSRRPRDAEAKPGDLPAPVYQASLRTRSPTPDGSLPGEQPTQEEQSSSLRFLLRVFGYNDAKGWLLNAGALVCIIVSGIALPFMDVIFGRFVNVFNDLAMGKLSPAEYRAQVARFSLYFIYLFVAKFVLTYVWTVVISITSIRTVKELRVDFVRSTLRQEISFFDTPSASTSNQITNGNLVSSGISEKLGLTVQALVSFIAAFIIAFVVQWKLTLIVLAIVPVNIVITMTCVVRDTVLEYRMFGIYGQSGNLAQEVFASIRTAHAFWAFPVLVRRFNAILDRARAVGDKKSIVLAIMFPVEFFCVIAGYGLAFWQGMRMYSSGEIQDPGTVVTVIFAIVVAAQSLTQIAPQTVAISKATAAAQDLFRIIDRKSAIDSLSPEGVCIKDFKGEINLQGVRFAYPSRPNVPILSGLDLVIPANKTTALVGASGSGKSTLFGILERWYPLSAGSVTFDGHKLEDINLCWLRTNVRLVQQEPTLFSGTIFQNVADGLAGTDMAGLDHEEKYRLVVEACKAAYAHEFIDDLPKGYETFIGERGASLSGGQNQRIVIARTIISNPRVLLLDEATSALDPRAEGIVQAALNNVGRDRTLIVIAHRLSTVRDADNIVVMSKGEVIESGTHQGLIDRGGAYASLVQAQDLGKGASKEDRDDKDTDGVKPGSDDLDTKLTSASSMGVPSAGAEAEHTRREYSLLHGLWLIIGEQPPLWWPLFLTLMCCLVCGGTYPVLAVLFARTMETFQSMNVSHTNFLALMFFIVALANFAAYAVVGWTANVVAQTVMRSYRAEIFNNTLRQDLAFFDHQDHSTGALVSRLAAEPTALQELLSINLSLMVVTAVNIVSSAVLAISFGCKLGLTLALGALPLLVCAGYARIRLEFKLESDTAARFASSSGIAAEAVMAIRTVSSLALERVLINRYEERLRGIATKALGDLGWKMLFYALSQSLPFLSMALGFWYGGQLVSTGEYSTSQFYVVFMAVHFSGEAAALFFQYSTSITKARTAINYIFDLRRRLELVDDDGHDEYAEDEIQAGSGSCSQEKSAGESSTAMMASSVLPAKGSHVECEGVNFAYPLRPHQRVLRGIDLEMPSGKMVALVGASGCGKSTMIALLERFYDPTTGTIRTDGHEIRARGRRRHRRDIALVQQEPVLYQGSIYDNVALGIVSSSSSSSHRNTASTAADIEAAVEEACRAANVWDFIASLPRGLGTPCGPQGLALSGGQRQRIAIARALVRQPRLLLLDEATSALDSESERVVKDALDRAAAGRTTVSVAHRLGTIHDAHTIAVFARGAIVERGTHDELVALKGIYYQMVLSQSLNRESA